MGSIYEQCEYCGQDHWSVHQRYGFFLCNECIEGFADPDNAMDLDDWIDYMNQPQGWGRGIEL